MKKQASFVQNRSFIAAPKSKKRRPVKKNATQPNRVDFVGNEYDCRTAIMALMGLSNHAISNATPHSNGQIYYRLKKAGVKRADYRNGDSALVKYLLDHEQDKAREILAAILSEKLGEKIVYRDGQLFKVVTTGGKK